MLCYLINALKI